MSKLASQVLDEAADLLSQPDTWTKHELARDKFNQSTTPRSFGACKWCMEGAISNVLGSGYSDFRPFAYVRNTILMEEIWKWNDDDARTQEEVVTTLRKAAELARSEGQ